MEEIQNQTTGKTDIGLDDKETKMDIYKQSRRYN